MKAKKLFSIMLAMMVMVTSLFTLGFADDDADLEAAKEFIGKNITVTEDGKSFTTTPEAVRYRSLFTTDPEKAADETEFCAGLYLAKGKTAADVLNTYRKAVNSDKTNSSLKNVGEGLGIEADTSAAAAMLSGFTPVLSLLLGVIVTLITVFMTVFSAFDIAYIAFPVFRNKCEDAKVNGGAMARTKSNGETQLRFVTDDAQYAVQQGSVESGKSPWAIYFKKRVMSYILLAIILFILMTGNITLITNIAVNIVAGIMDVLGGLAA